MTHEEAALRERLSYLERELGVWSARREKAMVSTCKAMKEIYLDSDLDKAMGQMRGEVYRIKLELGEAVIGDADQPKPRVRGKRRAKAAN